MGAWGHTWRAVAAALAVSLIWSAGCTWPPKPEPLPRPQAAPPPPPKPAAHVEPKPAPPRSPVEKETPAAQLSRSVRRMLSRPPKVAGNLDVPLRRKWNYIVIHHSQTDQGSEAIFDRYHKEKRRWKGVGYDFVIGNGHGSGDGLVEVTFRWEQQITGAHAASKGNLYNREAVGICLVGDFEGSRPTQRQMIALAGLVNYLQTRCRIPTAHIIGHDQVPGASTKCPGRNFPWYEFYAMIDH